MPAFAGKLKTLKTVKEKTLAFFGSKTLMVLLAAGIGAAALAQGPVTLTHVHGLAYSSDGKRLMVPSHHGLAVYENGKWSKAPGPQHDYMGFSATAQNLYTSGHPAPRSSLINPFGLMRSRDGGKTWEKLGLEGETDFHVLGTGWNTNVVYVWNPAPSSRLARAGLHFTADDGKTWKAADAAELVGDPIAVAAHPDDPNLVAVATSRGIFESADAGASFRQIDTGQGTAIHYDLDGKHLWHGSFDGKAQLLRSLLRGGPPASIPLPQLTEDAVAFIAQNPARRSEYAIATFRRSAFLSKDGGKSWTPIADQGKGL